MLIKQILDALACPDPGCRKPLKLAEDESAFQCTGCGRIYPVKDGIPMLFIDEDQSGRTFIGVKTE
jgi:uncharacterized protein YbaR (Trm112 family)